MQPLNVLLQTFIRDLVINSVLVCDSVRVNVAHFLNVFLLPGTAVLCQLYSI